MENPLKARRINANYSMDQVARKANVTHDNVVRNEQGLFSKPNPAILEAIATISGDSPAQITMEYIAWVAAKRRQEPLRTLVKRQITFPPAKMLHSQPFLLWRTAIAPNLSRIAFCQLICCHPATLFKYEKGDQRTMPSQIFEALYDAGMSKESIETLADLGATYYTLLKRRSIPRSA
jgi:transcriptional regulator with XRE-family HTH domain